MKALVLAAGLGRRLRPLTAHTPKCLVPVGGRPLLHYWLASIKAAGIDEVLINTHHHAERVREFLRGYEDNGLRISEFFEPELLGSAGTIAANGDWMQDADYCVVIYADNYSEIDLRSIVLQHIRSGIGCTMLLFEAPDPTQCGVVELDSDARVIGFEEKPVHPKSKLVNGGIYVLGADLFEEIATMKAFDLAHDVFPRLLLRIQGFVFDGYHKDVGTMESLAEVERHLGFSR